MDDRALAGECSVRAAGKRLTPQRRLVLRILAEADGHLDAGEIYAQAHQRGARLSLATVYRTLSLLKEAGTVRELHLDEEHHHYELDARDDHSHLVCLLCGRVIEVPSTAFLEVARTLGEANGFAIASAQVELTGICAACRRGQAAAEKVPGTC